MRIGSAEAYACMTICCDATKQLLGATLFKLSEIKRSPDAFQKICLIALAAIRAVNYRYNTNYFPRFVSVLDAAPVFDFYGFCRLPRYFLHRYCPENFKEYEILDQLEAILCDNWHLGVPDGQGLSRDPKVRQFAKEQITHLLDKMVDEKIDFRTQDEMKIFLSNRLKVVLEERPKKDYDPATVDLKNLEIRLKSNSELETAIAYAFISADIACVPDFLQAWQLIDLAPYANALGGIPVLSWWATQDLGDTVWGALCTGFILQFINAAQDLWKGKLSPEEATEAKWIMAASLAEGVYCGANLLKKDEVLINSLALVAKSFGLIAFLAASKPSFFTEGEDVFVVDQ